jgi:YVTN family beta-propeller protein
VIDIHVYVANDGYNTLTVINAATNAVTATIPVGGDAVTPVVSPNGRSRLCRLRRGRRYGVDDRHRH